jgi:hypothetical protein
MPIIQPYYIPNPATDPYPYDPEAYLNSIRSSIGAETEWSMLSDSVGMNFAATGALASANVYLNG